MWGFFRQSPNHDNNTPNSTNNQGAINASPSSLSSPKNLLQSLTRQILMTDDDDYYDDEEDINNDDNNDSNQYDDNNTDNLRHDDDHRTNNDDNNHDDYNNMNNNNNNINGVIVTNDLHDYAIESPEQQQQSWTDSSSPVVVTRSASYNNDDALILQTQAQKTTALKTDHYVNDDNNNNDISRMDDEDEGNHDESVVVTFVDNQEEEEEEGEDVNNSNSRMTTTTSSSSLVFHNIVGSVKSFDYMGRVAKNFMKQVVVETQHVQHVLENSMNDNDNDDDDEGYEYDEDDDEDVVNSSRRRNSNDSNNSVYYEEVEAIAAEIQEHDIQDRVMKQLQQEEEEEICFTPSTPVTSNEGNNDILDFTPTTPDAASINDDEGNDGSADENNGNSTLLLSKEMEQVQVNLDQVLGEIYRQESEEDDKQQQQQQEQNDNDDVLLHHADNVVENNVRTPMKITNVSATSADSRDNLSDDEMNCESAVKQIQEEIEQYQQQQSVRKQKREQQHQPIDTTTNTETNDDIVDVVGYAIGGIEDVLLSGEIEQPIITTTMTTNLTETNDIVDVLSDGETELVLPIMTETTIVEEVLEEANNDQMKHRQYRRYSLVDKVPQELIHPNRRFSKDDQGIESLLIGTRDVEVDVINDDDEDKSLRALAHQSVDLTRDTVNAEFDEEEGDVYDDENETYFGPIVDHTPTRANIRINNNNNNNTHHQVIEDDEDDDDEDGGRDSLIVLQPDRGNLMPDDGDASFSSDDDDDEVDECQHDIGIGISLSPRVLQMTDYDFANALTPVVDHTPDDTIMPISLEMPILNTAGLSLGVCPSEGDTIDEILMMGDDDNMNEGLDDNDNVNVEEIMEIQTFGPMVDVTPPTPLQKPSASASSMMSTRSIGGGNSLAVNFASLEEDFQEDAAMDETYYGDSTVGGGGESTVGLLTLNDEIGWGDEDLVFIADEEEDDDVVVSKKREKKTTTFSLELPKQHHVVDHTPAELLNQDGNDEHNMMPSSLTNNNNPSSVIAIAPQSVDYSRDSVGTDNDDDSDVDEDDIYRDENELPFGRVVDIIPKSRTMTPSSSRFTAATAANKSSSNSSTGGSGVYSLANSLAVLLPTPLMMKEDSFAFDDGIEDHTSYGGDGDSTIVSNKKKTTTFSLESNTLIRNFVVDHTPSEVPLSEAINNTLSSVAAVFAPQSIDFSKDSGTEDDEDDDDIYHDENEIAFGRVVDKIPTVPHHTAAGISSTDTPPIRSSSSATGSGIYSVANSLAVQVPKLLMKEDSFAFDLEDQASYGGDSTSIVRTAQADTGLKVSNAMLLEDNEAEQNNRDNKDDRVALVDHTPSDMGIYRSIKNPSIEALRSELNTRDTCDADSTGENMVFGPMVDLTPTTPNVSLFRFRSDSVVVQVYDLDTVDETTVFGGRSRDVYEIDTVEGDDDETTVGMGEGSRYDHDRDSVVDEDEDIPGSLPSPDGTSAAGGGGGGKLVDYVPPQTESRFGDASIVAAADPSEVLSEVDDDLAPEEQNFGPVVDVTPVNQPIVLHSEDTMPSGAGSTVVFASPSVIENDLEEVDDDDDEEESNLLDGELEQAEVAVWNDGMPILGGEPAPNPQSGNDEEIVVVVPPFNEQLVDFLPPVHGSVSNAADEEDATRGYSEVTVGGAQSLLLQTGEPVEDDFGPVVDLTPFLPTLMESAIVHHYSNNSVTSQSNQSDGAVIQKIDSTEMNTITDDTTISERRVKSRVVVDPLPRLISNKPMDSTATAGRSQTSEEEEDDASNKFGPVVDQLPTSRASVAPSRGGSTVDAMANVSEADNSDEDEEEGEDEEEEGVDCWEGEDIDFDASLGGVSELTGRHTAWSSARKVVHTNTVSSYNKYPHTHHITTSSTTGLTPGVRFVETSDNNHLDSTSLRSATAESSGRDDIPTHLHHHDQGYSVQSGENQDDGWGDDDIEVDDDEHGLIDSGQEYWHQNRLIDKSFAEADTPPSTPYRRSITNSTEISGMMDYSTSSTTNQFPISIPFIGDVDIEHHPRHQNVVDNVPMTMPLIRKMGASTASDTDEPEWMQRTAYNSYDDGKEKVPIHFVKILDDQKMVSRQKTEHHQMSSGIVQSSSMNGIDLTNDSSYMVISNSNMTDIKELLEQIQLSTHEKESLRMENGKLRYELMQFSKKKTEISTFQTNKIVMKEMINSLQNSLQRKDETHRASELLNMESVATLTNISIVDKNHVTMLEKQSMDLKTDIINLQNKLSTTETDFQKELSSQRDKLDLHHQASIDEMKQLMESMKLDHMEEISNQYNRFVENERQHETVVKGLEVAMQLLVANKEELITDLSQQRDVQQNLESSFNQEIASLKKERDSMQVALQNSQATISQLESTVHMFRLESDVEHDNQAKRQEADTKNLHVEIKQLQLSLSHKDTQVQENMKQIDALYLELESTQTNFRESESSSVQNQNDMKLLTLSLNEQKERCDQAERENTDLRSTINTMKETLKGIESENLRLQNNVASLNDQIEIKQKEAKCSNVVIEALQKQRNAESLLYKNLLKERGKHHLSEEEKLMMQVNENNEMKYSNELTKLKVVHEQELNEKLAHYQSELNESRAHVLELASRQAELETTISTITDALTKESSMREELHQERNQYRLENEELLIEFGIMSQQINLAGESRLQLESELHQLQDVLELNQASLIEATKKYDESSIIIIDLERQIKEKDLSAQALIFELENQIVELNKKNSSQINELEQHIQEKDLLVKAQLQEANERTIQLEANVLELNAHIDDLAQQTSNRNTEFASLQELHDEKLNEFNHQCCTIAEYQQRLQDNKSLILELQTQCQGNATRMIELESNATEFQERLAAQQTESKQLIDIERENVQSLQLDLQEKRDTIEALEAKVLERMNFSEELNQSSRELVESRTFMEAELGRTLEDYNVCKNLLEEKSLQIDQQANNILLLEQTLHDKDLQQTDLLSAINVKEQIVVELNQRVEKLESLCDEWKTQLASATNKLQDLESSEHKFVAESLAAQELVHSITSQVNEKDGLIRQFQHSFDEVTREMDCAKIEYAKCTKTLNGKIKTLGLSLQDTNKQLQDQRLIVTRLTNELNEARLGKMEEYFSKMRQSRLSSLSNVDDDDIATTNNVEVMNDSLLMIRSDQERADVMNRSLEKSSANKEDIRMKIELAKQSRASLNSLTNMNF